MIKPSTHTIPVNGTPHPTDRKGLQDALDAINAQLWHVEAYINRTCAFFGVTRKNLLGRGRTEIMAYARFHLMRQLHECGHSYNTIATYLRKHDHTTISYGIRRHQALCETHDGFRKTWNRYRAFVKEI